MCVDCVAVALALVFTNPEHLFMFSKIALWRKAVEHKGSGQHPESAALFGFFVHPLLDLLHFFFGGIRRQRCMVSLLVSGKLAKFIEQGEHTDLTSCKRDDVVGSDDRAVAFAIGGVLEDTE